MLVSPYLSWKQYFVESYEAAATFAPSVGITQEASKWFRYVTFCSKNIDTWMCKCLCLQEYLLFTTQCTIVQSAVLRSHAVCLSVTLVDHDHIGWKSWKLIARTMSVHLCFLVFCNFSCTNITRSSVLGLKWLNSTLLRKLILIQVMLFWTFMSIKLHFSLGQFCNPSQQCLGLRYRVIRVWISVSFTLGNSQTISIYCCLLIQYSLLAL